MGAFLNNLLGQPVDVSNSASIETIATKINGYVGIFSAIFLSICAALVLFFAIYVGFRMAKAEDDKARQDAKSQLIYSIIGVISIAVLAVMLQVVVKAIGTPSIVQHGQDIPGIATTYESIKAVISAIITLLSNAAVVFAVYVGWQLMKAEDDAKRKQAKMQLLYTIIAVIAIVLINVIASAVFKGLIDNVTKTV